MTRSSTLLVLLCTTVLGWLVEALPVVSRGLDQPSEVRAGLLIEPRQWKGPPPWLIPSIEAATTTLTLSVPGATGPPSPTFSGSPASAVPLSTGVRTATPDAGDSLPSSTVDRQSSGEGPTTDTMPTDTTTFSTGTPSATDISEPSNEGDSGIGSHRTLVISLSTILSAVGLALILVGVFLWRRRRQRRLPFLSRGVSPIDDDEIERWKSPRDHEKAPFPAGDTDVEADAAFNKETGAPSHAKHPSTSSVKKPPSVIVYNRPHDGCQGGTRQSTDAESRRSFAQNHPAYSGGKTSFDKALPQTPIQARAPNARAGLTDESVPGDEPFLFSPKRIPSRRLSKLPPNSAMGRSSRAAQHARARSSRSSTRSFGEYYYASGGGSRTGSDLELSPRYSHDHAQHHHHHSSSNSREHSRSYSGPRGSHSRVYSSSSIPPRLSFGDEVLLGGLSPARPRFPGEAEIGRAIG